MGFDLEELYPEYQSDFAKCKVDEDKIEALDKIIARMEKNQSRYQKLERSLGIPWYFIAVIHERESSGKFTGNLCNGDPITDRTLHVPANRPPCGDPPFTWEECAEDALKLKDLDQWTEWNAPGMLYQLECYNGFGYRLYHEDVPSPYLWSFSSLYSSGKYDTDGHFNPDLVDKQAGAATLLRRMVDQKKDYVMKNLVPEPATTPTVLTATTSRPITYVVKSGDTLIKIAKKFGLPSWQVLWQANRKSIPYPNLIRVNQKLTIPAAQIPCSTETPPAPPPQETTDYTFRDGDTVTKIATFYNITLGDLFRLNPDLIKPGTVIKVPKGSENDSSIHIALVPGTAHPWLEIAEREEGVVEDDQGDNQRIIEYLLVLL